MMNNTPWFEKYLTRLLVDMHIPDWSPEMLKDFSADTYAEMMENRMVPEEDIPHIAAKLSELTGRDIAEIAETTTRNAEKLFGI